MRTPPLTRPALGLGIPVLLAACSGGGSDGGGGAEVPDPAPDPALVAELRGVLTAEGVTQVPGAPPVSDELFALGQALFFDKLLSGNMDVSCATCHLPSFSGGDARTLPGGAHGMGIGPARAGGDIIQRNSPSVLNAHLLTAAFWDSSVQFLPAGGLDVPGPPLPPLMSAALDPGLEILGAQAMFPPLSRGEMRGLAGENELADIADADRDLIWDALMTRLLSFPAYAQLFSDAYPTLLLSELNFAHAGNAIAAFEVRAFARFDSPLQRFLGGDDSALTNQELSGGLEFYGAGDCGRCHSGPAFSAGQHRNIGLPQFGPGKGDGPSGLDDFGRHQVTGNVIDMYRFRTPTLLNIELTAPYGHVGQYPTLERIVDHYRDPANRLSTYLITENVSDPALIGTQLGNELDVLSNLDPGLLGARNFNEAQVVAFLRSLTADSALDLSDTVPLSVPSGLALDQ